MSFPAIKQHIQNEASRWAARLEGGGAWKISGCIAAGAVAVAILYFALANRSHEFVTDTAERQNAALEDGSQVELNAQTTLVVDFSRSERRVRLSRGEALFTVAKDTTRPFVVETPSGFVRATGTVFNIRATRDQRVEITVLEGNVRVRPTNASAEAAVTTGRQAVLASESITLRDLREGAAQDAVAWRRGQVVFDDAPLSEVLERFSAYHAQSITVETGASDLRLGGRYALDDLHGFLDSIEPVLGVHVVQEPTGVIRVVRR